MSEGWKGNRREGGAYVDDAWTEGNESRASGGYIQFGLSEDSPFGTTAAMAIDLVSLIDRT